ncbi:hypothetical protein FGD71_002885 [Streptomyces sporangiiformans]|uniref:RNA polymerase sigma factor 70 region 4 type 2 domain-containing protein n=1 Tax=Streptomyces sporangiiformans TaxID=2315329 RepID=A0A505DQX0_9ACTN|nr:hypothetical protein FGD71_002885 [Streptomyces sporangiiformans]
MPGHLSHARLAPPRPTPPWSRSVTHTVHSPHPYADPAYRSLARLLALAVAEELESMPAAQRQVLVLRYYADLPIREIALVLHVPEGTIKSRLHTAQAAMRARLRQVKVI